METVHVSEVASSLVSGNLITVITKMIYS